MINDCYPSRAAIEKLLPRPFDAVAVFEGIDSGASPRIYFYEANGGSLVVDGEDILNTGLGGNTRWVKHPNSGGGGGGISFGYTFFVDDVNGDSGGTNNVFDTLANLVASAAWTGLSTTNPTAVIINSQVDASDVTIDKNNVTFFSFKKSRLSGDIVIDNGAAGPTELPPEFFNIGFVGTITSNNVGNANLTDCAIAASTVDYNDNSGGLLNQCTILGGTWSCVDSAGFVAKDCLINGTSITSTSTGQGAFMNDCFLSGVTGVTSNTFKFQVTGGLVFGGSFTINGQNNFTFVRIISASFTGTTGSNSAFVQCELNQCSFSNGSTNSWIFSKCTMSSVTWDNQPASPDTYHNCTTSANTYASNFVGTVARVDCTRITNDTDNSGGGLTISLGATTTVSSVAGTDFASTGDISTGLESRVEWRNVVESAIFGGLGDYADDSAASGGGVAIGALYRTGSVVKVRVS